MPSVVLKEANHEVLSNKPALKEKPIDKQKFLIKTETPEVGGLTYPVIFEPVQNVEFSRSVYKNNFNSGISLPMWGLFQKV